MPRFETAMLVEPYRNPCEDRADVITEEDRTVIVVADGAGGMGQGDVAAESVIREVRANYASISSGFGWAQLLSDADRRLTGGQTTAVVVDLRPDGIFGASVGDSAAWILKGTNSDSNITDLTHAQVRKPLLGSRQAQPMPLMHDGLNTHDLMLVSTDGFLDYAERNRIGSLIDQVDFADLPRTLIDTVRLPSGKLWDDTAVVVGRLHQAT